MRKVHLLFRKEDIDPAKITGKTAVIFDILLATSSITAALYAGAKEVIPAEAIEDAENEAAKRKENSYLLVGEYEGKSLEHFHKPSLVKLKQAVNKKTMILSTTNGTVAINQASAASAVYIASLLNETAAANDVLKDDEEKTIILICSGSSGEFCIEDFYGAGSFIARLLKERDDNLMLSESAIAAHDFYKNKDPEAVLKESRVGKMLMESNFGEDIRLVSQRDTMPVVPRLTEDKRICLSNEEQGMDKEGGSEIVE